MTLDELKTLLTDYSSLDRMTQSEVREAIVTLIEEIDGIKERIAELESEP